MTSTISPVSKPDFFNVLLSIFYDSGSSYPIIRAAQWHELSVNRDASFDALLHLHSPALVPGGHLEREGLLRSAKDRADRFWVEKEEVESISV